MKKAVAVLWANRIQNKENDFYDVPVRLQDEVYQILMQINLNFKNVNEQILEKR